MDAPKRRYRLFLTLQPERGNGGQAQIDVTEDDLRLPFPQFAMKFLEPALLAVKLDAKV